ncbi:DNA polymerase III epsilon subunit [Methylophaga thiooxydans]|uniref:DNA-directed DNA polymerase n=1 Tax=Methylophaga thiooxydans TaxID=392484 RepID=A0A0A0BD51_9GAMM|nr:exonuclease domain-containing protein [Methylophaga thiooxydans]KGM05881.1 DNA polymerase III epsilon subunit [Methylophaga thiooxydans]
MTDLSAFPSSMVILDCETTGGRASRDRLTEIALIEVEDGHVVKRWQTLLNPLRPIPPWITRLTGITDATVADAPTFDEIADELFAYLDGKVIVAHNARFDYSFLRQSFQRCGYTLGNKTLCSVKLSRQLFPEHRSHGLDRIIERLGLTIDNRHRAMADTEVLLAFFEHISAQLPATTIRFACKQQLKRPSIPSHVSQSDIDLLPEAAGIYRFYDANGGLLYIGKSVNIRERVLSHFGQDHQHGKELDISQQLHHITFQQTPSDFGAQLLENTEIKHYSPRFNRRQTKTKKLYQLTLSTDKQGYHHLKTEVADMTEISTITQRYGLFRSRKQAEKKMLELIDTHRLCQKLCGIEKSQRGACFGYQLKKCRGACCGNESAETYNLRLQLALAQLKNQQWPWSGPIVVEEHPVHDDWDDVIFHLIDQWCYLGQVIDNEECLASLSRLQHTPVSFDLDAYKILLRFLLNPSPQKYHHLRIKPISIEQLEHAS